MILSISTSAQALTSTAQSFVLFFTLTDILDGSGAALPEGFLDFLLEDGDLVINGQAPPGPISTTETGNGAQSHIRTENINSTLLGPLDDFDLGLGDAFSSFQINDTSVSSGAGLGQIFETFGWNIGVDNESGDDLTFVFVWAYQRTLTLVEMGAFDDATVFLDRGTVSVDDGDGFTDEFDLFPDQLIPGNNPLNIGTLPPGAAIVLTDSGSFSVAIHGVDSQFSTIEIEWEVGARSVATVPEPSPLFLLAGSLALTACRRA